MKDRTIATAEYEASMRNAIDFTPYAVVDASEDVVGWFNSLAAATAKAGERPDEWEAVHRGHLRQFTGAPSGESAE